MSNSDNTAQSQAPCRYGRRFSTACPGMALEPPLCGDAIAWNLILLGVDCGRPAEEITRWLLALEDVPFWPDRDTIAVLMADAGL